MKKIISIGILIFFILAFAGYAWLDEDYSQRIPINISKVSTADDSEYPFVITLNDSVMDFDSILSNCNDLRLGDEDDNALPYFVEACKNVNETVIWTLTNNTDHIVYVYYGYASASNQSNFTAVFGSDVVAYWGFNEQTGASSYDLSGSGNHGTYAAVELNQSAMINRGFWNDQSATREWGATVSEPTTFTLLFWANITVTTPDRFFRWDTEGSAIAMEVTDTGGANTGIILRASGTAACSGVHTNGQWEHIGVVYRTTGNEEIYVDGTNCVNSDAGSATSNTDFTLGTDEATHVNPIGIFDTTFIYQTALSADEIEVFAAQKKPSIVGEVETGGPTNFSVTLLDIVDSSQIYNFSISVDGETYTTESGTIITNLLSNESSLYSVEFFNITDNEGYFNFTKNGINVSSLYTGYAWQSNVSLFASEIMTGNNLTGVFYIDEDLYSGPVNLKAGGYNFTYTNPSYYNKTVYYYVLPLFNDSINVSDVYGSRINISVFNAFTGSGVSNFTGWIYNADYDFNQSFSSDDYSLNINSTYGDFQIYVENENYAVSNDSNYLNVTVDDVQEYYNFSLWSNNSIMMYIRDETSNNYIVSNVTVTIDGENSSVTNYTTTGELYVQDLTDGNYSIKFSATNYTVKTYTVSVADRSTQTLNAYLSSEYSSVIMTVLDDLSGGTIEGLTLQMSRQINSTWTVVENKLSDVTGRAQFSYIPNVKYRFYLSGEDYTDKTFDLDPILFSSYTIRMDRNVTVSQTWDYAGISFNYYPTTFWNNQTNNVTFFISSPDGSLTSYGILIEYPAGSVTQSGINSIGDEYFLEFNITDADFADTVNISVWYDTVFSENKSFSGAYAINGFADMNNTFINNRDNTYGMGMLERVGIMVLGGGVVAGFAYYVAGPLGSLFFGLMAEGFIASILNLPIWLILIPALIGFMIILNRSSGV